MGPPRAKRPFIRRSRSVTRRAPREFCFSSAPVVWRAKKNQGVSLMARNRGKFPGGGESQESQDVIQAFCAARTR